MFEIKDATFEVNGKPILNPIEHTFHEGKVYGLIGHNGSGKSTLAAVLLGSPEYVVTKGRIRFRGDDITDWSTDVRGKAGIFLAFQYPLEIAGVSVINFLRQSLSARKGIDLSVLELRLSIMEWMERLGMDPAFADRNVNEGFSGGEKKRNEILQMALLEPRLGILDETDSGLDVDALKIVAEGVNNLRSPDRSFLIVTHYQRLLNYIKPDVVHILVEGKIVKTGGPELALDVEKDGYKQYTSVGASA